MFFSKNNVSEFLFGNFDIICQCDPFKTLQTTFFSFFGSQNFLESSINCFKISIDSLQEIVIYSKYLRQYAVPTGFSLLQ